jgi:hypothetical protein
MKQLLADLACAAVFLLVYVCVRLVEPFSNERAKAGYRQRSRGA